jgi:hypothetical protein
MLGLWWKMGRLIFGLLFSLLFVGVLACLLFVALLPWYPEELRSLLLTMGVP